MAKITDRQMLLEHLHGKPIRNILKEALERHRGRRHHTVHTASELDVTVGTIYKWGERLGIDVRSYAQEEGLEEDPDAAAARGEGR